MAIRLTKIGRKAVSMLETWGAQKGQAADSYWFVRHGLVQTVSPGTIHLLFNSIPNKICLETWTLPPSSSSFSLAHLHGLFAPESSWTARDRCWTLQAPPVLGHKSGSHRSPFDFLISNKSNQALPAWFLALIIKGKLPHHSG